MASNKHVDAFRATHLKPGEVVAAVGAGYIGEMMGSGKDRQRNGVLIVSSERVVFYRKGWLGEVIESIPLKAITSIERRSVLGHRTITLHTSHDALRFKTVDAADERALAEAIDKGRASTAPAPQQQPEVQGIAALRELASLRDAGVITQPDFDSKKAQILARL